MPLGALFVHHTKLTHVCIHIEWTAQVRKTPLWKVHVRFCASTSSKQHRTSNEQYFIHDSGLQASYSWCFRTQTTRVGKPNALARAGCSVACAGWCLQSSASHNVKLLRAHLDMGDKPLRCERTSEEVSWTWQIFFESSAQLRQHCCHCFMWWNQRLYRLLFITNSFDWHVAV